MEMDDIGNEIRRKPINVSLHSIKNKTAKLVEDLREAVMEEFVAENQLSATIEEVQDA